MHLFGEVLVTMLVILDPPGNVPIFLAVTQRLSDKERHRAAFLAVGTAFFVISLFAVGGRTVLDYLHVSVPALQAPYGAGRVMRRRRKKTAPAGVARLEQADAAIEAQGRQRARFFFLGLLPLKLGFPPLATPASSSRSQFAHAEHVGHDSSSSASHRPSFRNQGGG